ncbi:SigB/SigF/SigG family RNA polymerase sigma factor [Kitasatospora sp. NBC_01287]|uniref:SigB/SigF/SigG family RNA polymerase sigma factor n=1 Tax=Kitasatospora sp. NBC_01287 TaxID=2903573 RepID=UPI002257C1A1|nr:SigB/SigF/SigG family RNA polymerase sigma factor [Kitasatospora sp. NBC_01287]MCX4751660.1 SigB/SigF/SigG family RNA polymerase sigma factor [Kitasatospora sp. NBC_01287]
MPATATVAQSDVRVDHEVQGPAAAQGAIEGARDLRDAASRIGIAVEDDLARVCPTDARALSKVLFARLRAAEEGTDEYSYVRATLIELNMALVKFAASRFRHRSEPQEDIVQVGVVGLIKAIDRFDPAYEVEFSTFAIPTISGEIKRFFRDTGWMVHVPRRLQELRLELAKASDALEQALDRVPTTAELAEHLELTEAEVAEGLTAAQAQSTRSLDAPPVQDDPRGGSPQPMADRLTTEESRYELILGLHALKPLIAALPERDRTILSLRFGADLTQAQIGKQLGISQMHVSRLLNRTLGSLRTALLAEE